LAAENILLLAERCVLNGSLELPFYPKTTLAIKKV
jgi:hypothetical protein